MDKRYGLTETRYLKMAGRKRKISNGANVDRDDGKLPKKRRSISSELGKPALQLLPPEIWTLIAEKVCHCFLAKNDSDLRSRYLARKH